MTIKELQFKTTLLRCGIETNEETLSRCTFVVRDDRGIWHSLRSAPVVAKVHYSYFRRRISVTGLSPYSF